VREQVIPQKVGNRSGLNAKRRSNTGGAVSQRPTRRAESRSVGMRLRSLVGYVPVLLKVIIAIALGIGVFAAYQAASAASFFQLSTVEVQGESRASLQDVQGLVRREVTKSGVWQADLTELSSKLERLPWVRRAVVSRVLPDGIRVRIVEREPRAVVRTGGGRFIWVDEDAVMLGEMLPADQLPPFFLRGWNEDEGEAARKENSERVRKFMELRRDWDALGLSERVSEVNLIDLRDVRAQLADDDSQIEVRLGAQDLGKRLRQALEVLDGQRNTPRGSAISYIDLNQGKGAIVGFVSGAHASTSIGRNAAANLERRRAESDREQSSANKPAARERKKKRESKAKKKETDADTRPRRVRAT
jgi:cell division protein FtsQ